MRERESKANCKSIVGRCVIEEGEERKLNCPNIIINNVCSVSFSLLQRENNEEIARQDGKSFSFLSSLRFRRLRKQ